MIHPDTLVRCRHCGQILKYKDVGDHDNICYPEEEMIGI